VRARPRQFSTLIHILTLIHGCALLGLLVLFATYDIREMQLNE